MITEECLNLSYHVYDTLEELPHNLRELFTAATDATFDAEAPFSGFSVGAACVTSDGALHRGSNQESVSFPTGLCAERTLLFSLRGAGNRLPIISLAIASYKDGSVRNVSPCGLCRQTLLEVESSQKSPIEIVFKFNDKFILIKSAKMLLPLSFEKF